MHTPGWPTTTENARFCDASLAYYPFANRNLKVRDLDSRTRFLFAERCSRRAGVRAALAAPRRRLPLRIHARQVTDAARLTSTGLVEWWGDLSALDRLFSTTW